MEKVIRKGKKKWALALFFSAMVMVLLAVPISQNIALKVNQMMNAPVIVIDPGHGGMDGGASSARGTTEKDINLKIGLYVKELAEMDGFKVVMTRDSDMGLHGKEKGSIRSQKTQDLLARKEIIKKTQPLLAVSIHLNSFKQDTSVKGAQTFYPLGQGEEQILQDSKLLAETIQEHLVTGIADGSNRVALGKKDMLMFKNPTTPIVLVECGFLSNAEEANLLETEDYQRKLAKHIYEGILEFSGLKPVSPPEIVDSKG